MKARITTWIYILIVISIVIRASRVSAVCRRDRTCII